MQVDYKDFKPGECPITVKNIEKYKISDNYIKNFCKDGCCPICDEMVIQHIQSKKG